MDVQGIKQRFGIIGNSPDLNRAIEVAVQVAPTDLSVLITGESGTGKEIFPQIIHQYSARKHGKYIAVNDGALELSRKNQNDDARAIVEGESLRLYNTSGEYLDPDQPLPTRINPAVLTFAQLDSEEEDLRLF